MCSGRLDWRGLDSSAVLGADHGRESVPIPIHDFDNIYSPKFDSALKTMRLSILKTPFPIPKRTWEQYIARMKSGLTTCRTTGGLRRFSRPAIAGLITAVPYVAWSQAWNMFLLSASGHTTNRICSLALNCLNASTECL
jgi:hypothetical protein